VFVNDDVSNISTTMSYTDGFLKFGYTPTYNILDYLEGLNNTNDGSPKFMANKEYLVMPEYIDNTLNNVLNVECVAICSDYVNKIKEIRCD
jgi:hypothetical protein